MCAHFEAIFNPNPYTQALYPSMDYQHTKTDGRAETITADNGRKQVHWATVEVVGYFRI